MRKAVVLIKGGGDLASGVAHVLVNAGVGVMVTELAQPKMVRRKVSFGNVVYEREIVIEGVRGVLCASVKEAFMAVHSGRVAVLIDPTCSASEFVMPAVLVDAVMAKKNTGTRIYDAPAVIALGPGFEVGRDCHAVIETVRGENMGKVLYSGTAAPPTGKPAEVKGYGTERVLRAPAAGVFQGRAEIGDAVRPGTEVACVRFEIDGRPGTAGAGSQVEVVARIAGVLRGLLADGVVVEKGQKVGDIDPNGQREDCFRMSDKARAVGRGVIDAIRRLAPAALEEV